MAPSPVDIINRPQPENSTLNKKSGHQQQSYNPRKPTAVVIESIRRGAQNEFNKNPKDFYLQDMERVMSSVWAVKRFALRARSSDQTETITRATENLIKNLKWRKSVKINERTESTFGREMFETGLIGYGQNSKTGKKMLYIKTKVYRRQPELTSHFYAFGNALFDRIDREVYGKEKVSLFIDFSDISLQNADVNFLRYYINLLADEFPMILDVVYLYEPPWYIKPLVSMFLSVLPERMTRCVKMLDKNSAPKELGIEGVPDGAGGNLNTRLSAPQECPSIQEFAMIHNISMDVINKALRDYNLLSEC